MKCRARSPSASLAAIAIVAIAQPRRADAAKIDAGKKAFLDVAKVLQSPRCMNCHPRAIAPLQTDASRPHAQNISRKSVALGLPCTTCHQSVTAKRSASQAARPARQAGACRPPRRRWCSRAGRPPRCASSSRIPAQNGHRTMAQLLDHVAHDPLVGWGWNPGGKRTLPPLTRDQVVAAMQTWIDSGGACPE